MSEVYEADSSHPVNIWYCYKGGSPDARMPSYFNTQNWKWIAEGERRFTAIREEIDRLLASKHQLESYFNTALIETGKWEVLDFYFWGRKNEAHCKACPELSQWLDTIPGLTTAGVSRLAPHTEIKPHPGDTNAIARCHFGLSIPAGLPECGIMVNGEKRAWNEGKILAFSDAYIHSAWNHTDQFRYVLILDVVLPRFLGKKKSIAANVKSFLRLQAFLQKHAWAARLPGPLLGVIRHYFKFTGSWR